MSACEQADLLGPYHDGELPDANRRAVEAHAAGCPACAHELERLRSLSARLDAVRRLALTADQKQSLYGSAVAGADPSSYPIGGGRARPRATHNKENPVAIRWVRWLTAAAAAVFLVAAVQLFLHRGDAPGGSTGNPNEGTAGWKAPVNPPPGGDPRPPAPRPGTSSRPAAPAGTGSEREAS